ESGGSEETAREYINKVRRRAHEVNIDVASDYDVPPGSPNLLDTLKNERYVEFFGEGIYWFDLVRWGNAPDSLSEKGFVEGKHERLPIPIQEIELNEALEGQQNQGY
ncbi:MAG: RagB/SusD family nutrient uptake outer membrane protein, partial [Bacteroidota bacterium]